MFFFFFFFFFLRRNINAPFLTWISIQLTAHSQQYMYIEVKRHALTLVLYAFLVGPHQDTLPCIDGTQQSWSVGSWGIAIRLVTFRPSPQAYVCPSTFPILRVFFFFLTRQYSCIACWKCVDSVSTLSQCSCHWFSDNTFGVKLDLVWHVIYPTHC